MPASKHCGRLFAAAGRVPPRCVRQRVVRDGEVSNLKDISSLALRIVCEHIGLGSDIAPQLFSADGGFGVTLILSPPGGGKTTLLRDLIRVLSLGDAEHRALRVAVIDERCELAVCCKGRAQMELGNHTDVLSLCQRPPASRWCCAA